MRKLLIILICIAASLPAYAQKLKVSDDMAVMDVDAISDEQLDTINVRKKLVINDYSMIGVQYGAGLSRVSWNPSQKQQHVFSPINVGVTFTRYGKMFGYMPFFGFQAGVFYAREGYQFKPNDQNKTAEIFGAEKALIDVVEVPLLFQFHYDMWNMKILAQVGCYGGYRLSIERFDVVENPRVPLNPDYQYSFAETDRRWDYGIKGGGGIAFVYDPVEIQFMISYKHALASLYEPDYRSNYYYRFAYPYNFIFSVGANFHITKRTGRTKADLKKLAKEMVYNNEF